MLKTQYKWAVEVAALPVTCNSIVSMQILASISAIETLLGNPVDLQLLFGNNQVIRSNLLIPESMPTSLFTNSCLTDSLVSL